MLPKLAYPAGSKPVPPQRCNSGYPVFFINYSFSDRFPNFVCACLLLVKKGPMSYIGDSVYYGPLVL